MSNLAEAQVPDNDQPAPARAPGTTPLARNTITTQQVGTLLSVLASALNLLNADYIMDPPEATDGAPSKDGGVRESLEVTAMKACSRLDEILDDKGRWNLESTSTLEASVLATHASQRRKNDAEAAVSENSLRPSQRMNPRLVTIAGGWACVAGSLEFPEASLIGYGVSPEEAARDFDNKYNAKSTEEQRKLFYGKMAGLANQEAATDVEAEPRPLPPRAGPKPRDARKSGPR